MQTNTGETGKVKPQSSSKPQISTGIPQQPHIAAKNQQHIAAKNQQHIDEKTALIVGGVAAGLLMIWISSL